MMEESEFKEFRKQTRTLERIAESLERIAGFFEYVETAWAQADDEEAEGESLPHPGT